MKIRFFSYVRVLGLFFVLLYHFYPKVLSGGFIGVDIFFTFSGYLITALAVAEWQKNKRFDLAQFAKRRFFRIFPTVFFAMLLTLPLTLLGSSDLRYNLQQQVFAGLGFISNLYEASTHLSYENNFAPHLFVHLWSLALEVQFYVLWGLVIWGLSQRAKKAFKGLLFLVSCLFFLLSAGLMTALAFVVKDFSYLYYQTFLHIFPFFLGAALALLAGIDSTPLLRKLAKQVTARWAIYSALLATGALVILAFFLKFSSLWTYSLGFLATSILTGTLILFLRLLHEKSDKAEPKIVAFIADVSYGVYVFHWVLLIILKNLQRNYSLSVLGTLVLSFALAALMFYGIDPILRGKRKIPGLFVQMGLGLAAVLLIFSVNALAYTTQETSLEQTLWQGSLMQDKQQIYLSDKRLEQAPAHQTKAPAGLAKSKYKGEKVLVIGDSVTMGARDTVLAALPAALVDAKGSRRIDELPGILASYEKTITLPKNLVFALGTNCFAVARDIGVYENLIKKYGEKHHIVLVTPANWGQGRPFDSDKLADWELSIKDKFKNVAIADWRSVSRGKSYFNADGIHISDSAPAQLDWLKAIEGALVE